MVSFTPRPLLRPGRKPVLARREDEWGLRSSLETGQEGMGMIKAFIFTKELCLIRLVINGEGGTQAEDL